MGLCSGIASALCWRRASVAFLTLTTLATAACGGGSSLSSGDSVSSGETLKIGLLTALSGSNSSYGIDQAQGFRLFVELNHGKLGGRNVQIVDADEGATPNVALAAAQRLVNSEQVAVIVGITQSPTATAINDLVTGARIPMIITNAGGDALTAPDKAYVWRTVTTQHAVCGMAGGKALTAQVKTGSVYLLNSDYSAGRDCERDVRAAIIAAGGTVAGSAFPPLTTSDFQPYITKVTQSGAKAIFAFLPGTDGVQFIKQYAQFGLNKTTPLIVNGSMTEGALLPAEGPAALGIYGGMFYSSTLDNPLNKQFVAEYKKKYGSLPGYTSVASYDAGKLLDLALIKTKGKADGPSLVEAFSQISKMPSPRGDWTFGPDHNPIQHWYLRQVKEVNGVLVNEVIGDLGVF